jgi:hypothetical protein
MRIDKEKFKDYFTGETDFLIIDYIIDKEFVNLLDLKNHVGITLYHTRKKFCNIVHVLKDTMLWRGYNTPEETGVRYTYQIRRNSPEYIKDYLL